MFPRRLKKRRKNYEQRRRKRSYGKCWVIILRFPDHRSRRKRLKRRVGKIAGNICPDMYKHRAVNMVPRKQVFFFFLFFQSKKNEEFSEKSTFYKSYLQIFGKVQVFFLSFSYQTKVI